jgi:hypothetical protein
MSAEPVLTFLSAMIQNEEISSPKKKRYTNLATNLYSGTFFT